MHSTIRNSKASYSGQHSSPAVRRRSSSSSSSSSPSVVLSPPSRNLKTTATAQQHVPRPAGRETDLVHSQFLIPDVPRGSSSSPRFAAGPSNSSHPSSKVIQAAPRVGMMRFPGNNNNGGPSKTSGSGSNKNNRLVAASSSGGKIFSVVHDGRNAFCSCKVCTDTALAVQQFYDRQQALSRAEVDEIVFLGDGFAANNEDPNDIEILDDSGQLDASIIEIPKTRKAKTKLCEVCTDDKPLDGFYQLKPCLHAFCRECLEKSILIGIEDRNVKKLKCMSGDCMQLIEYVDVARILSDVNKFKEYDTLLAQNEISGMGDIKVCPNPACGMQCFDIRAEENEAVVTCPYCKLLFCLLCKKVVPEREYKTHRCELSNPIIIEALDKYENPDTTKAERETLERQFGKQKLENLTADRLSQRVVDEKKRCPGCRAPTDKDMGCNHMTCRTCGVEWCWLCGAKTAPDEWRVHFSGGTCGNRLYEGVDVRTGQNILPAVAAAAAPLLRVPVLPMYFRLFN